MKRELGSLSSPGVRLGRVAAPSGSPEFPCSLSGDHSLPEKSSRVRFWSLPAIEKIRARRCRA
ncbi:unnamed protein product [Arabidopsis halleri]